MTRTDPDAYTIKVVNKAEALRGINKRDVTCGMGGNGTIRGLDDDDELYGNHGRDRLHGVAGKDLQVATPGRTSSGSSAAEKDLPTGTRARKGSDESGGGATPDQTRALARTPPKGVSG